MVRGTRHARAATGVLLLASSVLLGACGSSSSSGATTTAAAGSGGTSGGKTTPPPLTFDKDTAHAATASISPKGGTVTAKGSDGSTYTLTIPADGLAATTAITLVPLLHVKGIPSDKPLVGVLMQPTGLQFQASAELEIDPATPYPVKTQAMFLADDSGGSIVPAAVDVASKPMKMFVPHFTLAVAGSIAGPIYGSYANQAVFDNLASMQAQMQALLGAERQRQLLGVDDPAASDALWAQIQEDITNLEHQVQSTFEQNSGDCLAGTQLVTLSLGIERQRQLLGLGADTNASTMMTSANELYPACEQKAIKECKKSHKASILIQFWLGITRQAELLGSSPPAGVPTTVKGVVDKAIQLCEPPYTVTGGGGGVSITGTTRSLEKPFTVSVSTPSGSGSATLTPSAKLSGSISSDMSAAGGVEHTTGTYMLTEQDDGSFAGTATVKTCLEINGVSTCSPEGTFDLTITPQQ